MANAVRWSPDELAAHQAKRRTVATAAPVAAPRRGMNKTETRYVTEVLEPMKRGGAIKDYGFERIRLELARRTWFWPDFDVVQLDNTVEIHDVKGGFVREDAWIKLKLTAEKYRHFRVFMAKYGKGKWATTEVIP